VTIISSIVPNVCLVFDLDDTLYLERDYVRSGFYAVGEWVREHLQLPDFFDRAWRAFEDGVRRSTFEKVLIEAGFALQPEILRTMVEVYRCHKPDIQLLPDASYCLLKVRERVRRLGLITDGPALCQHAKCARLGLLQLMDAVVCTGEWGEQFYKPHPRAYQFFASREEPDCRFLYVADNPRKDFITPLALGWHTVRVRRPLGLYHSVESTPATRPALELSALWELPEIVHELSE
jgi:putative hydrolase of the HAD superfamily